MIITKMTTRNKDMKNNLKRIWSRREKEEQWEGNIRIPWWIIRWRRTFRRKIRKQEEEGWRKIRWREEGKKNNKNNKKTYNWTKEAVFATRFPWGASGFSSHLRVPFFWEIEEYVKNNKMKKRKNNNKNKNKKKILKRRKTRGWGIKIRAITMNHNQLKNEGRRRRREKEEEEGRKRKIRRRRRRRRTSKNHMKNNNTKKD